MHFNFPTRSRSERTSQLATPRHSVSSYTTKNLIIFPPLSRHEQIHLCRQVELALCSAFRLLEATDTKEKRRTHFVHKYRRLIKNYVQMIRRLRKILTYFCNKTSTVNCRECPLFMV